MVVVGDDHVIKTHIHTNDPGTVLAIAGKFGGLDRIKIENMRLQQKALLTEQEKKTLTVRAVLFDLDNTLTHRDLSVQAYSRYLAEQYSQMLNLGADPVLAALSTSGNSVRQVVHQVAWKTRI